MQIFVKANDTHALDVSPLDTVDSVVAQISAQGYPAECTLAYEGKVLQNICTLADYDIQAEATLSLDVPVLGGKVHGSLARAGKVRGQTPKVAKQEKKKKAKGRAARRIQYNRRFVSTVVGFGKKKGPNSQGQ
eukprot:JP448012.1.p3 GENE.JP448012.1~~JP448012.1.p3  ORF type:complete len:143 (+),score=61.88 JP448012.1:32-430(+)